MLQTTEDGLLPPPRLASPSTSLIALVGFMGAGKTTVGAALARRLGWLFCDVDQVIEGREGRPVAQIFAEDGEERFREMEYESLRKMMTSTPGMPIVFALGGGAWAQPAVRQLLRSAGAVAVWLNASVEELYRRCEYPGTVRPLRRGMEDFRKLYETRLAAYREAEHCVHTEGKTSDAVIEEIVAALSLVPFFRSRE